MTNPDQTANRLNRSAALASIAVALLLLGLKAWAALSTGSTAMLGSLADTGLDLVASLATLAGVWIAAQPDDDNHRFGHGKAIQGAADGRAPARARGCERTWPVRVDGSDQGVHQAVRDAVAAEQRMLKGPGLCHEVGQHDHRLGLVLGQAVERDDALHSRGIASGTKVDAGRAEVVALDREPTVLEKLAERREGFGERHRVRFDRRRDEYIDLVSACRIGVHGEAVHQGPGPCRSQLVERRDLNP